MNASWLPAALGAAGVVVNLIWTALNMMMRADLARQISEMKESMRHEFVTHEICDLRMNQAA